MKRRSLLAMILSLVMCMGMSLPAWAAESDLSDNLTMDAAISDYSIVKEKATDDECQVFKLTNEKENVEVTLMKMDKAIKEQDIKQAYYYAQNVFQEEIEKSEFDKANGIFNYNLVLGDTVYFYEKTADNPDNTTMIVYQMSQEDMKEVAEQLDAYKAEFNPVKQGDNSYSSNAVVIRDVKIPQGFGGRVVINNTTNKYLSFNVELPTISEVTFPKYPTTATPVAYIYGGFEGGQGVVPGTQTPKTYNADIGVRFSEAYQVWQPFLNISKYTYTGKQLSGYNQVYSQNGFIPSASTSKRNILNVTIHPYNDQQNGLKGSVRLKIVGMTKYTSPSDTTPPDRPLTVIVESADSDQSYGVVKALNIKSVTNHKLLCLMALGAVEETSNTHGTNWCKFTNININGREVTQSMMTFEKEYATFPSYDDGRVEIKVSK